MSATHHVSTDRDQIDRVLVHAWLSEQAYWALGRSRTDQDAAIDASRNYGVYETASGAQVGYARVVTDGVSFAWLCDVFVAAEVRGRGVGQKLIAAVLADLDASGLKRTILFTADAHTFYTRLGFAPLDDPAKVMVRFSPADRTEAALDAGSGA